MLLLFDGLKLRCPMQLVELRVLILILTTLQEWPLSSEYSGPLLGREESLDVLCVVLGDASPPIVHQVLDEVILRELVLAEQARHSPAAWADYLVLHFWVLLVAAHYRELRRRPALE